MMKKVIEQEAQQKFRTLEKNYLTNQGIAYDFKIEVGFISDRIEDHAKKNDLSFLVMDKTMKGNSNESLDELANHIHVPMLLVP